MRDLAIVTGVACVVRMLAVLTLPLIITNDGAFYLSWGREMASGLWPDLPAYRTPIYPLWLAGVLFVAGDSVHAVLSSQQLLGVATAAACWWLGRVAFGPRVGLIAGILVAVDPWLLAIASFALSDMLSIALPLVSLAVVAGSPRFGRSTIAGALLGTAILTRPTAVAWLPGVLAMAMLAPAAKPKLRWIRGAAVVGMCATTLAPWVGFNASRGIGGVVETEGLALWGGLARSGQLDPTFSIPEPLRAAADPLFEHTPPEWAVMRFYKLAGDTQGVNRAQLLPAWSAASLRADPLGYAKSVGHAVAWQANASLPRTPYAHDPLRWMMRRLGGADALADAPANISTDHLPDFTARFADAAPIGPLAVVYRSWSLGMAQRFPQLPLGVITFGVLVVTAYQKRWDAAMLLASPMPIVAGHAIILQPFSRYSISAWMIWWIGGVAAAAMLVSLITPDVQEEDTSAQGASNPNV